jgi:hypothetical protein
LWRCVMLWYDTNVSKLHAASICRGKWEIWSSHGSEYLGRGLLDCNAV